MFAKFLRFGAMITAPLAFAACAHADYAQPQAYGTEDGPSAIILFSGEGFSGDVREIFDPVAALPDLRFNDAARSIAVISGQWEVCENSDFTGRCVFLREDVERLDWFGLDREISSVRPIYEYTDAQHGLMFTRDRNGYIRYAENQRYDTDYGYDRDTRIIVEHYGYSTDYRTRGYYNPYAVSGYGPYGFGYAYHDTYGRRGYSYRPTTRVHRPRRTHFGARNGAITLYEHSNGRGLSLGLNGSVPDLRRYRLNNNLSSVGVTAGRWEVCDRPNYQGTCRIINAPDGFLNIGRDFNDRASSIRRLDDSPRPVGRSGRDGRRDGVGRRRGGAERPVGVVTNDRTDRRRAVNDDVQRRVRTPRPDRRPELRGGEAVVVPSPVTRPDRRRVDRRRVGADRIGVRGDASVSPAPIARPDRRRGNGDRVGRRGEGRRAIVPVQPRVAPPSRPVSQPRAPVPQVRAPRPQPRVQAPTPQPRPQPQMKAPVQRPQPPARPGRNGEGRRRNLD